MNNEKLNKEDKMEKGMKEEKWDEEFVDFFIKDAAFHREEVVDLNSNSLREIIDKYLKNVYMMANDCEVCVRCKDGKIEFERIDRSISNEQVSKEGG